MLGTFNVIGPEKPLTIAEMLYGVKAITATKGHLTWVPWDFLLAIAASAAISPG